MYREKELEWIAEVGGFLLSKMNLILLVKIGSRFLCVLVKAEVV